MIEEAVRFVVCSVLAILLLFATGFILTSCAELKYAECIARDNTRNPCN